ncbi:MAG: hypothetical protein ABR543_09870 [Gemmatimonadaceae bacterium]
MSSVIRFTLGLLVISAGVLHAQERSPVVAATATGPTIASSSSAVRMPAESVDAEPAFAASSAAAFTRSHTLMIVGGAIFLTGLIVGDDAGTAIAIGGAAIGIYGLYTYLNSRSGAETAY